MDESVCVPEPEPLALPGFFLPDMTPAPPGQGFLLLLMSENTTKTGQL